MEVVFLGADTPLTKLYRKTDSGFDAESYPHVRNVTSFHERIESLEDFHHQIMEHGKQGHALLKGLLDRPLENESRAGHTDRLAETSWICLDLDFESGWPSIEAFVDDLDPAFRGVSFIFQHSASAGVKYTPGLRGHVFILLEEPVRADVLKTRLRAWNLTHPKLSAQLDLTKNGVTLKFPLDISTCQNDKLIYIAPPQCIGFDDPIGDRRYQLYQRERERARPFDDTLVKDVEIDRLQREKVKELRKAKGLRPRTERYSIYRKMEILANPDQATVTGFKVERGFVYLNLNGGDSWGYYFPEDDPEILYNFKGEPLVRLKDIAPEVYSEYRQHLKERLEAEEAERQRKEREANRALAKQLLGDREFEPFVFRSRREDAYYNGFYFPETDEVELTQAASFRKLQHFMQQFGGEPPEYIVDWDYAFDPTTTKVYDAEKRWVNRFAPTKFIRADLPEETEIPPIINRVIHSMCGSDDEAMQHFINWLAFIFQTRRKTGTAWVFHGVQGTGKGVFRERVLLPLFGEHYVTDWTLANLESEFNAPLEHSIFLWIDELRTADAHSTGKVMNKLKHYITENRIAIRGMRQVPRESESYVNVIIASNFPDPVQIVEHDRRFNVAPAQEHKLLITRQELKQIRAELPQFAGYLKHYAVDEDAVRQVLHNDARRAMIEASMTTPDRVMAAARDGDLDFFLEYGTPASGSQDTIIHHQYMQVLIGWCKDAVEGGRSPVFRHDLRLVYNYLTGNHISPAKFGRLCAIHRLPKGSITKSSLAGHWVVWKADDQKVREFLADVTDRPLSVVAGDADE